MFPRKSPFFFSSWWRINFYIYLLFVPNMLLKWIALNVTPICHFKLIRVEFVIDYESVLVLATSQKY